MKKIYFLAAFLFIAATSFGQRSCDLQLTHAIIPDTFKIQNPTVETIIRWAFKNNGPDSLFATDTLFLRVKNLNPAQTYKLLLPSMGIPKDSTVYFTDTFKFANGPANGATFNWCDSVWAKDSTGVIIPDTNKANNQVCKSVYTMNTTSINELFTTSVGKLTVYPNPAQSTIYFDYNLNGSKGSVKIYDLVGRLVHHQELEKSYGQKQMAIDVQHLNTGIYVVELKEGDNKSAGRVSVQK